MFFTCYSDDCRPSRYIHNTCLKISIYTGGFVENKNVIPDSKDDSSAFRTDNTMYNIVDRKSKQ